MPTLPMFSTDPSQVADAARRVTAPGGYEGWHFAATSDDGSTHLAAALHATWALDRDYLRRYWAYRRWPTRVAPPVPRRHPAITFALYERGRRPIVVAAPAPADDFAADEGGRSVRVGGSHFQRGVGPDGIVQLNLRATTSDGRTMAAKLAFRPHARGDCEVDLAGNASGGASDGASEGALGGNGAAARGGRHAWVVVDPLCDVNGEVSVFAEAGAAPRIIPFAGVGCHDHLYGSRPMGDAAEQWLSGRVLRDDRAVLFRRVGASGDAQVFDARGGEAGHARTAGVVTGGVARTGRNVVYPTTLTLAGLAELAEPKVVDSSWSGVVLEYRATIGNDRAIALVEVLRPRRVVWPLRW